MQASAIPLGGDSMARNAIHDGMSICRKIQAGKAAGKSQVAYTPLRQTGDGRSAESEPA